jgi:hypothetical protein
LDQQRFHKEGEDVRTGIEVFIEGLRELGYKPQSLPDKPEHIVIDYEVESGKFSGMKIKLGLVVPADFPLTPPSGPNISALVHPVKSGGEHPTGGVHREQAAAFQQALGGEWQYWSRPPNWATGKKTVAAYMSHIWWLWDSQ